MAFEHDFCRGRHAQGTAERLRDFSASAAQQSGELVFRQRVGNRRDGAEDGGRVGAQCDGYRKGFAFVGDGVIAKIQCAAAMR